MQYFVCCGVQITIPVKQTYNQANKLNIQVDFITILILDLTLHLKLHILFLIVNDKYILLELASFTSPDVYTSSYIPSSLNTQLQKDPNPECWSSPASPTCINGTTFTRINKQKSRSFLFITLPHISHWTTAGCPHYC